MPPPSRKKQKVENPVTNFHGERDIIGDAGDEVKVKAEEDGRSINISATDSNAKKEKDVVIRIERDGQLDRRARREKKSELKGTEESGRISPPPTKISGKRKARGTTSVQGSSSFSSAGSCFICARTAHGNFLKNSHQERRLRLMRVNMFKDAAQEVLENSYSLSPSSETCEECDNIVEQVWDLQHKILLIKEELRKIITEAVKQGVKEDLAKDHFGEAERRQKLGLEFQELDYENEDEYFPSTNANVDQSPIPIMVEMLKEEQISDFEGNTDVCQDYEDTSCMFQLEEELNEKTSTTRQKRKSRIKAEMILMANENQGQVESSDEEYSEFVVTKEGIGIEHYASNDDEQFSTDSEAKATSKPKPSHNTSQRIRCSQCDVTFKSIKHKELHIKRVHEKSRPYPCTLCDKRFFSTSERERHHIVKHEIGQKWKCQKCGKQLREKHRWLSHEIFVCKIDHGEAFYKEQKIVFYPCEFQGCPMKFIIKKDLNRHSAAHSGEKAFVCSKCGAAFPHVYYMQKHERDIDCTRDGYKAPNFQQSKLKRNHPCSLCPHKCLSVEGLAHHQKTVHDIDPPPDIIPVDEGTLTCHLCGVTLAKRTLQTHMKRVHENIKRKACPHCEQMFHNGTDLKMHIRRRHHQADQSTSAAVHNESITTEELEQK